MHKYSMAKTQSGLTLHQTGFTLAVKTAKVCVGVPPSKIRKYRASRKQDYAWQVTAKDCFLGSLATKGNFCDAKSITAAIKCSNCKVEPFLWWFHCILGDGVKPPRKGSLSRIPFSLGSLS